MNYIHIILDIILIVIGLYIVFGKSYLAEKGKNLATKEDIGIITGKIETVKNDLALSTQRRSEFLREKKDVALKFNDQASFFIDFSSKVMDLLVNNSNNADIILKQNEDIRLQGAKLISTFLKIYVYIIEDKFRESAENYYNATVKVQRLTVEILLQLEQIAQKEATMMDSFRNGQLHFADELNDIIRNRKELIEKYINDRNKLLEDEVYKMRIIYIHELSELVKLNNN
jgi:hypothetical protein